jgi:DNA-binding transcriptional ArsR family regulator
MTKKKSPLNGPKNSTGSAPASGRSSRARGSFKRNRSKQMTTLVLILATVNKVGAKGREFSTSELREAADVTRSQAYTWLQVLRTHGFVTARLVKSGRSSGDWRWKRRFRILKVTAK